MSKQVKTIGLKRQQLPNDVCRCSSWKCDKRETCARADFPLDESAKFPVSNFEPEECENYIQKYFED